MSKLVDYVVRYYKKLPKSSFNDEEFIVVSEMQNEDMGYGHHSYSGVGVSKDGKVYWLYSSGCSCNGSCGADRVLDLKKFEVERGFEGILDASPKSVDFDSLRVDFRDY
jgi:hypothetical protein